MYICVCIAFLNKIIIFMKCLRHSNRKWRKWFVAPDHLWRPIHDVGVEQILVIKYFFRVEHLSIDLSFWRFSRTKIATSSRIGKNTSLDSKVPINIRTISYYIKTKMWVSRGSPSFASLFLIFYIYLDNSCFWFCFCGIFSLVSRLSERSLNLSVQST